MADISDARGVAPAPPDARELDALVAKVVMGETVVETDDCNGEDNLWLARPSLDKWDWPGLPHYSTDIAAAWSVVERIDMICNVEWASGRATVDFVTNIGGEIVTVGVSRNKPLPLAICLAALDAADVPRG